MSWFRHPRAHGRSSHRRHQVALVAGIALAGMSLGAMTSPASTSSRADGACRVVVPGASWKIASRSGSAYTLVPRGMSCATARPWAVRFTHQTAGVTGQAFKGPAGFTCRSFATSTSGDKLLYSGVCMKGPHNHPFFEWAPKV
jgi:hypothetical protein